MDIKRISVHLFSGPWRVHQALPKQAMDRIAQAITASEKTHSGEVVFVVEGTLGVLDLFKGKSSEKRASELFSELGVWDTELNNAVMIYLLLADRRVQLVADRGLRQFVNENKLQEISQEIEGNFSQLSFEKAVLRGIERITGHLSEHFPAQAKGENALPDQPVVV